MTEPLLDSLCAYIDRQRTSASNWSVQIVNPTAVEPIQQMATDLFQSLDIEASEIELDGIEDDMCLLLRDGKVVASSPMKALRDTLLLVNADFYRTRTRSINEIEIPDVVLELSSPVKVDK